MNRYTPTARTTLRRIPARGAYDETTVHAILDAALVCHLGFVAEGRPVVIPTFFARRGEVLFVHGAAASRTMRTLAEGVPVCVTVALIDGLVLARSAFHHSMNYRSVVLFGVAREVTARDEKRQALAHFVEKMSPGRAAIVRPPTDRELLATRVLSLPLVEVSAKVRLGPPLDDADDMAVQVWAGVQPVALCAGAPQPDGAAGSFEIPALPAGVSR
ncbi:MAG: pyridoxamine 5'-phosphate oxidase family protein [Myxococcota bacterium]|nr:pyridoxamine 5'-phosphate oxidase family protein [Myxococcota bacterium]